jgi:hypothetical protein
VTATHARPRTATLVVILAGLPAALVAALAVLTAPPAVAVPAPAAPIVVDRVDIHPAPPADVAPELLAIAFGPAADYSTGQRDEVARVAAQVAADAAAGATVEQLLPGLCTRSGMLPEQARAFATVAAGLSA